MYLIFKLASILFAIGLLFTWRTQTSSHQTEFLAGSEFAVLPDGFWPGSADFPVGSWRGKRFDSAQASGMNVFESGGVRSESAPFRMYSAEALWDKDKRVTRIDYNVPENWFWLRPAVDEVVEVEPGRLVGKIHYRIFSGFSIALGYFTQSKQ